jgi:hypothetical protein
MGDWMPIRPDAACEPAALATVARQQGETRRLARRCAMAVLLARARIPLLLAALV